MYKTEKKHRFAITGGLRAGKDTAAEYLEEAYGFSSVPLGEAMRNAFHELFPAIPREPKPRAEYQIFGQALRQIDSDVWLTPVLETARDEAYFYPHFVIPDLRDPGDYEKLKAAGWRVILIDAPEALRLERASEQQDLFQLEDLQHETELAYRNMLPDYRILNNGSLEGLYAELDRVIEMEDRRA